jgi:hypothetical protein
MVWHFCAIHRLPTNQTLFEHLFLLLPVALIIITKAVATSLSSHLAIYPCMHIHIGYQNFSHLKFCHKYE